MTNSQTHRVQFSKLFVTALCALLLGASLAGCDKKSSEEGKIAITPMAAPTETCATGMPYSGNWNGGAWGQNFAQLNVVPYGHGMPNYHHGARPGLQNFTTSGYC
ncbi:MAG: hypothetical protein RBT63_10515, partial [Bdellovibrionales bacterium]|nr:hypothetical protein [Bdellovibrionales bacterium]